MTLPQVTDQSEYARSMCVAIGGNMQSVWGDPEATVLRGVQMLADVVGVPILRSPLYQTPAFPAGAGPDFINAALTFEANLPARDVLAILHRIEAAAARVRDVRWGQRTLDLDLIACGSEILPTADVVQMWRDLPLDQQMEMTPDTLLLPHPRLQDRSFVLVPLADIAPGWVHPALGQSTAQMRDARPIAEIQSVKPLPGSVKRVVNPGVSA